MQNLLDLDGYEFEKLMLQLFGAIPEFNEVRRTHPGLMAVSTL